MLCPVCKNVNLVMSERQNIEIDYCPQCRGVWLDRGELDKIIERTAQLTDTPDNWASQQTRMREKYYPDYRDYDDKKYAEYEYKSKKKKKLGFLGELFDFD